MKKLKRFALLLAALCLLPLFGCGDNNAEAKEAPDWGLSITTEDVSPISAVLRFTQNGGSPSGELNTGTYFILEHKDGSKWRSVSYADDLDANSVGWDDVAWIIPMGGSADFDTNWEWLYGELDAGEYRIGKEIMDFRGPGDYDTAMFYAEFTIN